MTEQEFPAFSARLKVLAACYPSGPERWFWEEATPRSYFNAMAAYDYEIVSAVLAKAATKFSHAPSGWKLAEECRIMTRAREERAKYPPARLSLPPIRPSVTDTHVGRRVQAVAERLIAAGMDPPVAIMRALAETGCAL